MSATIQTEARTPLATGPDAERLITLLAWLEVVTNPVEHDRYWQRTQALRREHPELDAITSEDTRIETRAMEIRADLEVEEQLGEYSDVAEARAGLR